MENIALPLFCALPYAGQRVRSQLWHAMGHLFYLELLKVFCYASGNGAAVGDHCYTVFAQHEQQLWRLQALEALAIWLSDRNAVMPKPTALERGNCVLIRLLYISKYIYIRREQ